MHWAILSWMSGDLRYAGGVVPGCNVLGWAERPGTDIHDLTQTACVHAAAQSINTNDNKGIAPSTQLLHKKYTVRRWNLAKTATTVKQRALWTTQRKEQERTWSVHISAAKPTA
jgi:hypothetical protein